MIKKVAIREAAADLLPLVKANGEEILGAEFNPSYEQFLQLEDREILRTFLIDDVGYAMFVVSPLLLQKHILSANCIALFLLPEARTLAVLKYLKEIEEQLLAEGLDQVHYQVDVRYTALFTRLGYGQKEATFVKEAPWRQV